MTRLTYFGHSAFLIEDRGTRLLIDPWISNPLSPVKPDQVDAEYIVITHDHGDHVGDAQQIARRTGAKVIAVFETAQKYTASGVETIGMNMGGPVQAGGLEVYLTPAAHSSESGAPAGAVIKGKYTIYHAGDTGLFSDMKLIGEVYMPHVALLPIGGHFTMNPEQAAIAVQMISPKLAVPMHYRTFDVLKGTPEEFEENVKRLSPNTKVKKISPGESLELEGLI